MPTQLHLFGHRLLTGLLQPLDRDRLKQQRESASCLGPRQSHSSRSMFGTIAARHSGMQHGPVLAGVQMPPLPLGLMVKQRAGLLALWAPPFDFLFVFQVNVNLSLLQLQIHALHIPGRFNSQNLSIKFSVLHADIVACTVWL